MPDVKWYSGDSITINNTRVIGGTSNRLLRNDGSRVQNSLLSDDGTNVTLASGQHRLPNGSAASPSLVGTNFTTTGLYWAADYLGLGNGGAAVAQVYATDFRVGLPGTRFNLNVESGVSGAITLGSASHLRWSATTDASSTADLFLARAAAANLRFGAAAANPPVAQTLSTQGASGTDIAGANFTVDVSPGTGTGDGGAYIIRTAAAGGTGSSQNALAAALTINSARAAAFSGGANGQEWVVRPLTELTTIAAAATTDTAIQIPVNAVVLAVSVRVTTAIPTAATFTVIGTTSSTAFNTAAVSTALNSTDVGTASTPYKNGAAQTIRITPNVTPADNTGRVRVTIHYYEITVPTS